MTTAPLDYSRLVAATGQAALLFQVAATGIIAVLSYVIQRSVRRQFMVYWTLGWALYCTALIAVFAANTIPVLQRPLNFAYFFFEYAAVVAMFVACYHLARGRTPRRAWWALVPCAVAALVLVLGLKDFYVSFALHGALMGFGWLACLLALWPSLRKSGFGPGVRILAFAFGLLALDYAQHLPTALHAMDTRATVDPFYYIVTSIVDGMLDFVLGFGSVIAMIDAVRGELQTANVRLMLAHQRTEEALHKDALTGTLNRYSFFAAFGEEDRGSKIPGCVVVVDLDDLKRINDRFGHNVGDEAIKAVARALLSLVRADDPVYRWGGDEFVVVMFHISAQLADQRMRALQAAIERESLVLSVTTGAVTATYGIAEFDPHTGIAQAIHAADGAMYRAKPVRHS